MKNLVLIKKKTKNVKDLFEILFKKKEFFLFLQKSIQTLLVFIELWLEITDFQLSGFEHRVN